MERSHVKYHQPTTLADALDFAKEVDRKLTRNSSLEIREPKKQAKEYPTRMIKVEVLGTEKRTLPTESEEVASKRPELESSTFRPKSVPKSSTIENVEESEENPRNKPPLNPSPDNLNLPKEPTRLPEPPVSTGITPLAPIGLSEGSIPYSIVEDLLTTPAHISLGQLMAIAPHVRRELGHNLVRKPSSREVMLSSREPSKWLPITLGGILVHAIIDPAADLSLISVNLVKVLRLEIRPCEDVTLVMANDYRTKTCGKVVVEFCIPGQVKPSSWPMFVLDVDRYDLLIGIDWLHHARAVADYGNRKLKLTLEGETHKVTMQSLDTTLGGTSAMLVECSPLKEVSDLPHELPERLHALLISAEDFKDAPGTNLVFHTIELTDSKPVSSRPYRMGPADLRILDRMIDDMLEKHTIEPSNAPYSFPVVLVEKEDGTAEKRFCVDYKALNSKTVRDVMPLPRQDDLLDRFAHCTVFSHLDLHSGFWQIRMDPKDVPKTTFTTYRGNYAFKVMPFGLTNAPATFQRLMLFVLRPCLGKCAKVYLDDIIIYSKTLEEHFTHLQDVFQCLRDAQLRMKKKKCRFAEQELTFLGHRVGGLGIGVDPTKCVAFQAARAPLNLNQLRSFLGLASYYRRFVKNFAHIAAPLNSLLKKNINWTWGEAQHRAFDSLKEALTNPPVLAHPHFDRPFIVYTDASDVALGAVLAQEYKGLERPIAYLSRALSDAEKVYSTTEKECLAAVVALKKWKSYLLEMPITLFTDHSALVYLSSNPASTGRLARWYFELLQYQLKVCHRPGKNNVVADYLSRPLSSIHRVELAVHPDNLFTLVRRTLLSETIDPPPSLEQRRTIMQKYFIDPNGVLMKKRPEGKHVPVIEDPDIQKQLVKVAHEEYGHLGIPSIVRLLLERCWWPTLYIDCKVFITGCPTCQLNTIRPPPSTCIPIVRGWRKLECLAIDYLGPLPESKARPEIGSLSSPSTKPLVSPGLKPSRLPRLKVLVISF